MNRPITPDIRSVARQIGEAMQAREAVAPPADFTGLSDARLLALQDQVVRALRDRPMRDFALDSLVEIAGRTARGVVRLRIDGSVWTLETVEAACLALAVRLAPDLRGAGLFADAFALASREAEQKLDSLRRFGVAVATAETR